MFLQTLVFQKKDILMICAPFLDCELPNFNLECLLLKDYAQVIDLSPRV